MLKERTCDAVRQNVAVRADLTATERDHLASCADCRAFAADIGHLDSAMDRLHVDMPPVSLRSRVAEAVELTPNPVSRRSKPVGLVAAWAATVTVLCVLVFQINKMADLPKPISVVRPAIDDQAWEQIMKHTVGSPKGDLRSRFTVVEFGDFCCPQCGRIQPLLKTSLENAPVSVYFVNRPFPKLKGHENAEVAAQAAYSAAAQGKFWPMFDTLYRHQKQLQPEHYAAYAAEAGVDGRIVTADVAAGKYLAQVEESGKFCDSIGVTMTPTLIWWNSATGEHRVAAGRDQIEQMLRTAPWSTVSVER